LALSPSTLPSRAVWASILVVAAAVLATAAWLDPDPAGHGTHTQLGLPPCGFLVVAGIPCPGCGLTTSFAHMIRLQLVPAFQANPFGVVLFAITAASVPIAAAGAAKGWPVLRTLDRLHFEKIAIGLAVAGLVTWGARLLLSV
jgi:hypothetical protein